MTESLADLATRVIQLRADLDAYPNIERDPNEVECELDCVMRELATRVLALQLETKGVMPSVAGNDSTVPSESLRAEAGVTHPATNTSIDREMVAYRDVVWQQVRQEFQGKLDALKQLPRYGPQFDEDDPQIFNGLGEETMGAWMKASDVIACLGDAPPR